MQLRMSLVAALLALFATVAVNAIAADALEPGDTPGKAEAQAKATPAKVTPHNHAQEKTGGPPPPAVEQKPAPRKNLHLHPRDGK